MTKDEMLIKSGLILLEQNDKLISERDEIRYWIIQISDALDITPRSKGENAIENWSFLRDDILEKLEAT